MPKFIDNFLNKITMYRIVLYVLCFLFLASFVLSLFNLVPYSPLYLTLSLLIILFVSYLANITFSYAYNAPTNVESIYITSFILFFVITPIQSGKFLEFLILAFWASVWSMASKYIFAINRKHVFNPAAFAVLLTALTINKSASWWIGTPHMLPFVLIGGFLIVRKLQRADVFFTFTLSALATISIIALFKGNDVLNTIIITLKNSAFFFFAFVMLTEPLTSPTTKWRRIMFAVLVGFLYAPNLHIGPYYSTPELALIIGNIFAYFVSPKEKLFLKLKQRVEIGTDTYDFVFDKDHKKNKNFTFIPGQYMEWTLAHKDSDSRGNRRYFTIASSPAEDEIHLGIKFYPRESKTSSFKNKMLSMPLGSEIIAGQRSGDFVLPKNTQKNLVFMAGGIGITPFRSMIQHLLDTKDKRKIVLLYSNKTVQDIAYKEIFDRAQSELGIKTIYAITDQNIKITDASMHAGAINAELIKKVVPNYKENMFYISGPNGMVNAFKDTLKSMGVPRNHIKIDFFPGFA